MSPSEPSAIGHGQACENRCSLADNLCRDGIILSRLAPAPAAPTADNPPGAPSELPTTRKSSREHGDTEARRHGVAALGTRKWKFPRVLSHS